MVTETPSFSINFVFKIFSVHTKTESGQRFRSSLIFCDGIVWPVGLTKKHKALFSNFFCVASSSVDLDVDAQKDLLTF